VFRTPDGSSVGPPLRPDGALIEAAFTPDARTVVTTAAATDGRGLVDFWDPSSGRPRSPTLTFPGPPIAMAVAASGRVAILYRDGLLHVLDGATGRVVRQWQCGATNQPPEDVSVSLNADGHTVLVLINGTLQVWDGETGCLRFAPPRHPGVLHAALSDSGRLIASAGLDSALRLWDAETGTQLGPALDHPSWIDGGVAFHPDSRHVLTICKDMAIRVWDVTTARLAAPPIQPSSIGAAQFSPDGQVVVTAGADGTVEIWEWRAGRRLVPPCRLPLATDWAFTGNRTVELSPDGRIVAVGGRPELSVLRLDDLYATEEESPEDLSAWAELIAHRRVHEGGTLVNLTGEDFIRRWHTRRRPIRLLGGAPPSGSSEGL
jgi:WD40 repeat protein